MAPHAWLLMVTVLVIVNLKLAEGDGIPFVKLVVTHTNYCQGIKYRFLHFVKDRELDCFMECGLRPNCKALNFHFGTNLCELFNAVDTDFEEKNCSHVQRKDISTIQLPCGVVCQNGSVCDENTKSCIFKGICDEFDVPENLMLKEQNGTELNSTRVFSCQPDYVDIETSLTWTCLPPGNWTGIAAKCVPKYCSNVRCYARYADYFLLYPAEEQLLIETPEECVNKCEEVMGDSLKSVMFKEAYPIDDYNCKCNAVTYPTDEYELFEWPSLQIVSFFTY